MRRITHIVMHTAGAGNKDTCQAIYQSVAGIRAFHTRSKASGGKGWSDIGYHWIVLRDGAVKPGRSERQMGAGVESFNEYSIHVCVTGHGDYAAWTLEQWHGAVKVVCEVARRYGLVDEILRNPMRVLGHREVSDLPAGLYRGPRPIRKTCPGKLIDMRAFRRAVVAELSEG